jgi:AcrR family transcriptional regulator
MKERFVRGAQTRLRIIRAAADLFHQKGARATSPDEVIEASQTGKGQFYHYFKNKEGLIHEVLQTHLDAIKVAIQGAMLMGKIKRSSQPVEAAAREAVAHLKSYLVKSDT